MGRAALFAYGSLVSPASASRTLDRPIEASAVVRLGGWRRRWSTVRNNLACEKTFARRANGELLGHVLGLNLEPAEASDAGPNGVLIELGEDELLRLDMREMRYDRIEVTEQVERPRGIDEVFTYRAKPAHFAPSPPRDAVVISTYAAFVESAFGALGAGQREIYLETTGTPPVDVVDAVLVRDRIPPGNPREW